MNLDYLYFMKLKFKCLSPIELESSKVLIESKTILFFFNYRIIWESFNFDYDK